MAEPTRTIVEPAAMASSRSALMPRDSVSSARPSAFSDSNSAWGLRSDAMIGPVPLGVALGAFAIILACVSLIADFDYIENAVKGGAPRSVEWKAAFGLVLTLVWLYIEFLRLIAILTGRD